MKDCIDNTVSLERFADIRALTNGFLHAEVYRAIYEAAKAAPAGCVVDIGPAQGGTTISLGLGRRQAGLLGRIYSIDAFCGSRALMSRSDVDLNKQVLAANLAAYELGESVDILEAGRDDPASLIPADEPIAVLSIDADGALDRDFSQYYDRLAAGAFIIIDDYEHKISDKMIGYSEEEIAKYVRSKGATRFSDVCPLGKHYTVYKFVNYFVEQGMLEIQDVLRRNTAFCRKPEDAPLFQSARRLANLSAIRDDIESYYWARRRDQSLVPTAGGT